MQSINEDAESFLQRFTLYGLNGYKTVSLVCKTRHKIVVGDNGSGKTSLLNALYSILAGKPALLYAMNFERFELEWSTGQLINASKIELFGNLDDEAIKRSLGFEFFTTNGLSEEEAIEAINLYILSDENAVLESAGYRTLYRDTPYDRNEILQKFERVASNLKSSEAFTKVFQKIKELLGDTAVLYLPTYRRIEADSPEIRNRVSSPVRRMRAQKDGWTSDRLINFGLEDVEEKLNSISTTIRKDTLAAYSRISGKTLEELITIGDSEDAPAIPTEVDIPSIQVVLSRIGRQSTETESKLELLIKNGEIAQAKYIQLRKFLVQLRSIYAARMDDEQAIEDFATLVNDYFSIGGTSEKNFLFDKQRVELQVINRYTQLPLKLGSLSSGEKQIISIFARLLLDPYKKYLIIIDEPELSLSIEWQERFLPDIVEKPSCHQLIAVTHSPFIFKNLLASVTGSLEVKLNPPKRVAIDDDGQ